MKLFLDLECVPTDDPEILAATAASITPPANYSKAETIAAWEAEKKPALVQDAIHKLCFEAGTGRIICIAWMMNDGPMTTAIVDEKDILNNLFASISKPPGMISPVGHNVSWDIRYIFKRAVVNRIKPPAAFLHMLNAKPWELEDTMQMWEPDKQRRVSLDNLCKYLGVPSSKTDMDGSKVWQAYQDGRIAEIAAYCADDVRAMRECYLRMTFQ